MKIDWPWRFRRVSLFVRIVWREDGEGGRMEAGLSWQIACDIWQNPRDEQ